MPEDRDREQEEPYQKVDRRVTSEDEPAPPEPQEPQAPETPPPAEPHPGDEPATAEAQSAGEPSSFAEVGVFGILRFSVSLLAETAWMSLGLIASPSGETREDYAQARVAIDALGDLVARLQPDLDESEKRELEQLLANLRVNFIQRAG